MRQAGLFILLLTALPLFGRGQSDSLSTRDSLYHRYYMQKHMAIVTGYQIQRNHFAEIGVEIMKDGIVGHHPSTLIYGLSNELKLSSDFIWGLKAGVWMGGGIAGLNMGLNLINYTDFQESSLRLRPEIGIGFSVFRVVYGYNFALTNRGFNGINTHNFALNIMLKVKTLKEEKR